MSQLARATSSGISARGFALAGPGFEARAAFFETVGRFFEADGAAGGEIVRRFGVGGVGGGASAVSVMAPSPNASQAARTSSAAVIRPTVWDGGSRRPESQWFTVEGFTSTRRANSACDMARSSRARWRRSENVMIVTNGNGMS